MTAKKKTTKADRMVAILNKIDAFYQKAIEIEEAGNALKNATYKIQSEIYEYFNETNQSE